MSIWGKLAAAELLVAGPIATLLGTGPASKEAQRAKKPDVLEENQVAFTVGVIVLGAKMAKADGVVTADEVKAFKDAFRVSNTEMKNAARVFNLAKQDAAGYETSAEQLVVVFRGNRKLLEDVLEGLFHIATADEALHPEEDAFLGQVAQRFGFSDADFARIRARHCTAAKANPYEVLGLDPSVSNDELERHYRALVADNHPDTLVARGVPKEFDTIAIEKVAALNAAYDAIIKERGI
jgi:DnaJ like chaperone protein